MPSDKFTGSHFSLEIARGHLNRYFSSCKKRIEPLHIAASSLGI
jgi:hypothetical protein